MGTDVLPFPLPAAEIDRRFRLRKGTTRKAIDAGCLRGCLRKGRGGRQAWIMPSDAEAWFLAGLPVEAKR